MKRIKGLIIYVLTLIVGLTVATQWTATQLRDVPIGSHVTVFGRKVYAPWSLVTWYKSLAEAAPGIFRRATAILILHALVGTVLVFALRSHRPPIRPMGTEQWGTLRDMKRAGLLNTGGTVVGRFRGNLLTYDGPEHQLVVGASRSGKGVGHVIPTLLTWPESALVYDIKGELWDATAGFRSRFSHCIRFNPTHPNSARYNPLLEIRKGANEIRDTQNIVEMLVNPDGSKEQLDVWDQHAAQLLVALILHVNYTQPDDRKHLGVVRELLLNWSEAFRDMIELPHRLNPVTAAPEPHPEVSRVASELLRQAPRFAAGVRATALGHLALYADEVICRNVSVSDFLVGDLVCAANPMTLYLQPPPSDLPRLRPLMRVLLNQTCRALMERLDSDNRGRAKRHRLLLEQDEFASLGRMEFFAANLRNMAGYGLKAHIIVQSLNDIVEKYGPHQTILDNCHVISVFACADMLTAERVSKMTGVAVEYRESYGHKRWLRFIPETVQQSEHVRPLLQPGDVRMLPNHEQLVFVTGHRPMRTTKVRFYADREFKRLVVPPPDASATVDTPRIADIHGKLGVPHDWMGERAKGPRIPSSEIHDVACDDEWTPPVEAFQDQRDEPPPPSQGDAYGL